MSLLKYVRDTLRRHGKNPAMPHSVTAVASGKSRPGRGWRKLGRKQLAAGVAVVAASAALLTVSPGSSASAAGFEYSSTPMYVGDKVYNDTAPEACTVGAVLWPRVGLTQYARSVRWLLLAGHCGRVGHTFVSGSGEYLGKVDWVASTVDMLTVKVEPGGTPSWRRICVPTPSGGKHGNPGTSQCRDVPTTDYYPRAKGFVSCISHTPRVTNYTFSVPALSNGVRLCGASSGWDYFYRAVLNPSTPAGGNRVVGQIGRVPWTTAATRAQNGNGLRGTPGDSGGPVFVLDTATNTVRLFGILSADRTTTSGSNEVLVVPLAEYFRSARNRLSTAIATS